MATSATVYNFRVVTCPSCRVTYDSNDYNSCPKCTTDQTTMSPEHISRVMDMCSALQAENAELRADVERLKTEKAEMQIRFRCVLESTKKEMREAATKLVNAYRGLK